MRTWMMKWIETCVVQKHIIVFNNVKKFSCQYDMGVTSFDINSECLKLVPSQKGVGAYKHSIIILHRENSYIIYENWIMLVEICKYVETVCVACLKGLN